MAARIAISSVYLTTIANMAAIMLAASYRVPLWRCRYRLNIGVALWRRQRNSVNICRVSAIAQCGSNMFLMANGKPNNVVVISQ